jgi:hypothetical protein
MFQSVKSKSIYWKYLLLKIKCIFLRDSYVCTRWIFLFDSDQAQINSVCIVIKEHSAVIVILQAEGKLMELSL